MDIYIELKAAYLAYYLDTALFSSFLSFPNLWSNIKNYKILNLEL